MEVVKVQLSPLQARKLKRGHSIQLKPSHIGAGVDVVVDAKQAKRLHKAKAQSKGCRMCMTPEMVESSMEGAGFRELLDKAKAYAGEQLKKLKSYGAQESRKLLKKGFSKLKEEGMPWLESKAEDLLEQGISKAGLEEKEGGFIGSLFKGILGLGALPPAGSPEHRLLVADLQKMHKKHPKYGGFLGSLLRTIAKPVAQAVLPGLAKTAVKAIAGDRAGSIAGDVAGTVISGLGAKRRGRKAKGAGLVPSGYRM